MLTNCRIGVDSSENKNMHMKSDNFGDWNASLYMRYASERTQPSRDLAAGIFCDVCNPKILDIGCGSGNSSRVLKERFPRAEILGIDSSADMIESARRANPDIEFRRCAITPECSEIPEGCDILFSNACLQWVPRHDVLFASLFGKLARGGTLAVQIPLTEKMPITAVLEDLKSMPQWRGVFDGVRDLRALAAERYYDIISSLTHSFRIWRTDYFHTMDGIDAVIDWYSGARLRPYFAALPECRRAEFSDCVRNSLEKYYPIRKNGKIAMPFARLFIVATKK